MDELGARLENLIKTLNISQLTFANQTGINQPFLSSVIHGRKDISRAMLEKLLLKYPDINVNWLFTGRGDMFLPSSIGGVSEPEPNYHSNNGLKIHPIASDLSLKGILIKNLKAAALRWDMYNQELFSVLDPTVGRQSVSKYMLGHSWPGMEAILRFELVTAIPVFELLTREIAPAELPEKPIEPGHQVAAELAAHLSRADRSLREFLASDFYQKLPK